jgi:hypothetical protein
MFCPPVSICVRKYVWMEVAGGLLDSALSELIFSQTYCEAAGGTVAVLWGTMGRHCYASAGFKRVASLHTATRVGRGETSAVGDIR